MSVKISTQVCVLECLRFLWGMQRDKNTILLCNKVKCKNAFQSKPWTQMVTHTKCLLWCFLQLRVMINFEFNGFSVFFLYFQDGLFKKNILRWLTNFFSSKTQCYVHTVHHLTKSFVNNHDINFVSHIFLLQVLQN